jgi:ankyrin repeat protein
MADEKGEMAVLATLLESGADVNSMAEGVSALHYASSNGHMDAVRVLVERGASVNTRAETDGSNALLAASCQGKT